MFESHDAMMEEFDKAAIACGYTPFCGPKRGFPLNDYFKSKQGIELEFDGEDGLPEVYTPDGMFVFGGCSYSQLSQTFLSWVNDNFNTELVRPFKVPDDGPNEMKFQMTRWGPIIRLISRKN